MSLIHRSASVLARNISTNSRLFDADIPKRQTVGNPIVIPAVTMHDHFALKVTPMTKGDKPLAAAAHPDGDIFYKLLQKVDRQSG